MTLFIYIDNHLNFHSPYEFCFIVMSINEIVNCLLQIIFWFDLYFNYNLDKLSFFKMILIPTIVIK